ncbi:MAG: hypothetical protein H0V82_11885 [Candidatus Protochlamydia sp.]|nr:hypothetical protein [Candidatus Protochlamydia sp.]
MKHFIKLISSLAFCFSFYLNAAHFSIQDLGTLVTEQSFVSGINENDLIAGKLIDQGINTDFIWTEKDGLTRLDHQSTYQAPLLNNRGVIAGVFWYKTEFWFEANTTSKNLYLRYLDGTFKNIGFPSKWKNKSLKDWQTPYAWDEKEIGIIGFNDKDQLLLMNASTKSKANEFAIWEKGMFDYIDRETLDKAYAINNSGIILGRKWIKENGISIPMLVLYDREKNSYIEIMKDINLFSVALNNLGEVAIVQGSKEENWKGFYWTIEKGLNPLDFLPFCMNNQNQIVGIKIFENTFFPVLCDNGKLVNIAEDLKIGEPETLWTCIKSFVGINDSGRIVGIGEFEGMMHGFMLTPQQ